MFQAIFFKSSDKNINYVSLFLIYTVTYIIVYFNKDQHAENDENQS